MPLSHTNKVLLIALTVLFVQGCESKKQAQQQVMEPHQEEAINRAQTLPPELQKALNSK
jgi:hypothetical protein